MNTKLKLLACLLGGLLILSIGCKKDDDDDPTGCNYVTETNDELQAVTDAGTAYANDPTNQAKCQAWLDANEAYLTALENHVDCATLYGNVGQLQDAINAAQAALDAIGC